MKVRDIALIGILSAALTAGKLVLSFIPNVEIVTLLLMVYTFVFGIKKSLLTAFVFSTIEVLIYGFSTWLLGYYLIWPMLIFTTEVIKRGFKEEINEYLYAAAAGIFGFLFGFFFALIESFFMDGYIWVYWMKGIPFDIVHAVSNFIITLLLFKFLVNIFSNNKKTRGF